MKELRYTLLPDGTSDRAFLPILTWLLRENGINCPIQADCPKLGLLPNPPKTLTERICISIDLAPCDLLFVHRDAEKEPRENRIYEIKEALLQSKSPISIPVICVIPVRMLEAWLLFDEIAIRKASSNPRGKQELNLPNVKALEKLPNPKDELCKILRTSSGLTGRKLKQFQAKERQKIQEIVNFIDDFSPLRQLSAFQALEKEIQQIIAQQGWTN